MSSRLALKLLKIASVGTKLKVAKIILWPYLKFSRSVEKTCTCVVNKLRSKEAYLVGVGHMVLGVCWGPGEGAGSHWMAGFRVLGAVGEL